MNHRKIGALATSLGLILGVAAAQAQEKKQEKKEAPGMEMPKPGPEQKKLGYFIGTWKSEGEIKENPMMPAGKMTSTDRCEWFHGGFNVVCHSTGNSPLGSSHGLGILGYNSQDKTYSYYGIDSMGFAEMSKGTVDGSTWTYGSEAKMGEKTVRSRYVMNEVSPTSYSFKYETSEDGQNWSLVMEGKSSKVEQKAEASKTAPDEKK